MGSKDEGRQRFSLLLKNAKDGDESAAAELVKSLAPMVITVLKRNFHLDRDDYQSIFHDALMIFIRDPSRYEPSVGDFEPLLIQTARNKAVDHLRKEKKHRFFSSPEMLQAASTPAVPFFDQLAKKEEIQELRSELMKMKPFCTPLEKDIIEIFLTDAYHGDWAKRLAEKHGVTANYVSVCWSRLRARVRKS